MKNLNVSASIFPSWKSLLGEMKSILSVVKRKRRILNVSFKKFWRTRNATTEFHSNKFKIFFPITKATRVCTTTRIPTTPYCFMATMENQSRHAPQTKRKWLKNAWKMIWFLQLVQLEREKHTPLLLLPLKHWKIKQYKESYFVVPPSRQKKS